MEWSSPLVNENNEREFDGIIWGKIENNELKTPTIRVRYDKVLKIGGVFWLGFYAVFRTAPELWRILQMILNNGQ